MRRGRQHAVAAVRLPAKFSQRYELAYFRLSRGWLAVFAVISVISCLGFVLLVLMELPVVGVIYLGWILPVSGYYRVRFGRMKKAGVDWDARIRTIPGFDEE